MTRSQQEVIRGLCTEIAKESNIIANEERYLGSDLNKTNDIIKVSKDRLYLLRSIRNNLENLFAGIL